MLFPLLIPSPQYKPTYLHCAFPAFSVDGFGDQFPAARLLEQQTFLLRVASELLGLEYDGFPAQVDAGVVHLQVRH